jgi:hypothetical protein
MPTFSDGVLLLKEQIRLALSNLAVCTRLALHGTTQRQQHAKK